MKEEWLGTMGLELGNTIDRLEVNGIHRIMGMDEIPIYVIKMPRLYELSAENKKIVKKEISQFSDIWGKLSNKNEDFALHDLVNYYEENLENSILFPLMSFIANYNTSQFKFDMQQRNFMQDAKDNIILVDPIVDRDVYNLILRINK